MGENSSTAEANKRGHGLAFLDRSSDAHHLHASAGISHPKATTGRGGGQERVARACNTRGVARHHARVEPHGSRNRVVDDTMRGGTERRSKGRGREEHPAAVVGRPMAGDGGAGGHEESGGGDGKT